jgi:hypothetical protein
VLDLGHRRPGVGRRRQKLLDLGVGRFSRVRHWHRLRLDGCRLRLDGRRLRGRRLRLDGRHGHGGVRLGLLSDELQLSTIGFCGGGTYRRRPRIFNDGQRLRG